VDYQTQYQRIQRRPI